MKIITETERLYLRELTADDGIHFYRINSDPEVLKYTGDVPFETPEAATEFLRSYQQQYLDHGMGRWAHAVI